MKPKFLASFILASAFAALPLRAESVKPSQDEIVVLEPYVVEAKSLANAGFAFIAKFRYHMIWAGIKELIIAEVGPRSEAKKAGLAVGEKILQIRDVKVNGLGIRALRKEFETKAVDGKVTLLIQSKDSKETRTVVLQFTEPLPKTEPNQPPETTGGK
jgi:S1-C subfamily serine protease